MIVEKLTIKDTFRIWRDKINVLFDYFGRLPITDEDGNYKLDETTIGAKSVIIDIPLYVNSPDSIINGYLDGNAKTASTLKDPVKINGTNFDGSIDIKTENWGALRNIRISDAHGKNFGNLVQIDGSNDYVLTLPSTIKADIDGNVVSNEVLSKPISINGVKFDGSKDVINYGVCSTDSNVAVKEVTLVSSDFILNQGSSVTVKFLNNNTTTDALFLNVNKTGEFPILYNGISIDKNLIKENSVFTFVYDGESYNFITTSLDVSKVTAGVLPVANGGTGSSTKNFVDLSSSQTVAGMKTFSDNIVLANPNVAVGTNPSSTSYKEIYFTDKSYSTMSEHRLGVINNYIDNTGTSRMNMSASKYDASNTNYIVGTLYVGITKEGVVTAGTNGTFTATAVYNAVWNDYAEFFPRGEETEAGDIISLDVSSKEERYIKATNKSSLIVGIHSDSYGHLIGGENAPEGQDFVEYNLPKYIPVGLKGRVDVKFKGKSQLGEAVVPSEIPGVGCLYDSSINTERQIVGYIVEDSSETEELRKVKIFLK